MEEIKGYWVQAGYMGYIGNGKYMLFANDTEYIEWVEGE